VHIDEMSAASRLQGMTELLPNLKILITIYANALTVLLYRWKSMLLWSRTLFTEWFSKTSI